ncbi:thioredoxin domain-containing protein [Stakelama saccharophila]|uniref:Thioredoxin domain-containing protein n=1 Tax=Stakelama saccharophila TaxID=3075605 RepID=A0ABZ0B9K3_9SPHN|nr:thioredoxin domain-containing protein [Stakelama sp. W311]WNO53937.1 thioredoxin domain-containing protein [Stakelama sp. W311]
MIRFLFLLLPALALAACSGGDAAGSNSANAAPVAGAKPPAGKQWHEVVEQVSGGGFRMGNPNAPIKLVEYGSRGCPVCGAFAREAFDPLVKDYVDSGKVSFEFNEFMVHGASDLAASLLGQCVATSAYFPVLEQMYADQEELNGRLMAMDDATAQSLQGMTPTQQVTKLAEVAGYIDFMKQRGLPEAKARACLNDQQKIETLSDRMQTASQDKNVTGTPTFFVNGDRIDGTTWKVVKQALENHGA